MTPRDKLVLRHIARHRLSIREVLEAVFFKTPDACGNWIARMLKAKPPLIESAKFPDGYSYYQLTDEGAQSIGLKETPRVRDDRGAHAALAALWFCHMTDKRKLLLTEDEEKKLLGVVPEGARHCLEPAGDWSVLHELYVPGSGTDEKNVIDRIDKRISERREVPAFRDWIASRNLGFAVLVEKDERRVALKSRIGKSELRRFTSIIVELAPGPATLREFIHARNGRSHGS